MLKPEHTIIINGFVARVRATQFSSPSQLKLFNDTLMEQLGITTGKLVDAKAEKANMRALNAVARQKFKQKVKLAWCKANLKLDDLVRISGNSSIFVVNQFGLETDLFEVRLVHGPKQVHVEFARITKVLRDGNWVDIFKLASGAV